VSDGRPFTRRMIALRVSASGADFSAWKELIQCPVGPLHWCRQSFPLITTRPAPPFLVPSRVEPSVKSWRYTGPRFLIILRAVIFWCPCDCDFFTVVKHAAIGGCRLQCGLAWDVFGCVDAWRRPRVSIAGVALLRFRRCWTFVRSSFFLASSSSRLIHRSAWIVASIRYRLAIVGRLASRVRASRGVERSWDVMDHVAAYYTLSSRLPTESVDEARTDERESLYLMDELIASMQCMCISPLPSLQFTSTYRFPISEYFEISINQVNYLF